MDDATLVSLILSITSLIYNAILHYKLKSCHSLCCDSDCVNTPAATPTRTPTSTLLHV
jgi:hypothetical protein